MGSFFQLINTPYNLLNSFENVQDPKYQRSGVEIRKINKNEYFLFM